MKSPVAHRFFSRRLLQLEDAYRRLKQWRAVDIFSRGGVFNLGINQICPRPVAAWAAGLAWSVFRRRSCSSPNRLHEVEARDLSGEWSWKSV
jgi:hypothetical protein